MYPALEINLRLHHVYPAQPSSRSASGYAVRSLLRRLEPVPRAPGRDAIGARIQRPQRRCTVCAGSLLFDAGRLSSMVRRLAIERSTSSASQTLPWAS